MKKIISIIIILFILTFVGGGFFIYQLSHYKNPETTLVYFEGGSSLRSMSQKLEEQNVVPSALFFEYFVRLQGKEKSLKAGEYEFPANIDLAFVLQMMVEGKVKLYPITIPEGYNLKQIGELFINKKLATAEEWEAWTKDPQLVSSLGIEVQTLEGYLFPETYLTEKKTTGKELIAQMVNLFKQKVTDDLKKKAQEKGFTLHQWVTLASIIEKETGVASERPLIASVFLNRLKIGMLLQTDPTVIYGIPNYKGNITRKNLETDTPYNTYTRPGLPPGPICSPGLEALMAVLNPASADYLYFVAKKDGTHYFSKTLEEHNRAVNFYQLNSGPSPEPQ